MSADLSTRDWSTDYDIFDPAYVTEPYPVWDALRRTARRPLRPVRGVVAPHPLRRRRRDRP